MLLKLLSSMPTCYWKSTRVPHVVCKIWKKFDLPSSIPVKMTYKNEALEMRAAWSYSMELHGPQQPHPSLLGWCRSGFPKECFPRELHPWVIVPQGEVNRMGAQDTGLPSCPSWGGMEWLP